MLSRNVHVAVATASLLYLARLVVEVIVKGPEPVGIIEIRDNGMELIITEGENPT